MPTTITSPRNPRIKEVLKLAKRRVRDERGLTVVEGVREVERALVCGIVPREAYVCPELATRAEAEPLLARLQQLTNTHSLRLYEVAPEVFARIAYRGESGGVLLVLPYFARPLAELPLGSPPFLVVVEGAEKPGNLGAILRTADAAGVDGVVVCAAAEQAATDVHNPNAIRASLGTVFSVPISQTSSAAARQWLCDNNIQIIATTPDATVRYTAADLTGPTAIVVGSEAEGLADAWLAAADQRVVIPMHGMADSLNLATATALLLYEVVRQRGEHSVPDSPHRAAPPSP
jgi:TrmH family RNA methyltransferase